MYLSVEFSVDTEVSMSLQGCSAVISKLEAGAGLGKAEGLTLGAGVLMGRGGKAALEKGGGMVKSGGVG